MYVCELDSKTSICVFKMSQIVILFAYVWFCMFSNLHIISFPALTEQNIHIIHNYKKGINNYIILFIFYNFYYDVLLVYFVKPQKKYQFVWEKNQSN